MPIFARKTTIFSQIRRYLQLKLEKVKKISFPQAQRLTFNAIAAKAYDEAAEKYHQQICPKNPVASRARQPRTPTTPPTC